VIDISEGDIDDWPSRPFKGGNLMKPRGWRTDPQADVVLFPGDTLVLKAVCADLE
jgi:hypothetical protein